MSNATRIFAVGCAAALAIVACNGNPFVGCAADKPEDPSAGTNELSSVVPEANSEPVANPPPAQLSCNGPQDNPCPATHYCASLSCNTPGQCLPRPESCTKLDTPVCGCDGQTYQSLCEAHRAGVGLYSNTACAPVPFSPAPISPPTKPTVLPNEPPMKEPLKS